MMLNEKTPALPLPILSCLPMMPMMPQNLTYLIIFKRRKTKQNRCCAVLCCARHREKFARDKKSKCCMKNMSQEQGLLQIIVAGIIKERNAKAIVEDEVG